MSIAATSADLPAPLGSLVGGKYRLQRVIAAGGMGVVVESIHEALEQRVAVKFLAPGKSMDAETLARFVREGRAAARLRSDHAIRVFDVGTHEAHVPYLVMEFLEGEDLQSFMDRQGAVAPDRAVDIVVDALEAVAEAHEAGIVHRDLKPANVFLAERPEGAYAVKVLDFGISKVRTMPHDRTLTGPNSAAGSPAYMSPEQVRSARNVDARADVWSMGVVLYEMLTGGPAYDGETVGDVFVKVCNEPLVPLSDRRPDLPRDLCAVVAKSLAPDREDRYPNGRAQRNALLALRLGRREASGDASPRIAVRTRAETPAARVRTQETWSAIAPRRRSHAPLGIGIAIGLAAAGAVAFAFLSRGGGGEPLAAPQEARPAMQPAIVVEPGPALPATTTPSGPAASASIAPPPSTSAPASAPAPPRVEPRRAPPARKKKDDLGI